MSIETERVRTQTTVSFVGFWAVVTVSVAFWDTAPRWYIVMVALGWGAAGAARALIDAHYLIKGSL